MTDSTRPLLLDSAATRCVAELMDGYPPGVWCDEVGCTDGGAHRCIRHDDHRWMIHRCRCDAMVIDETPVGR